MAESTPRLILASGSSARRAMLQSAGLSFEILPASIDESAIRDAMTSENTCVDPDHIATTLAMEKAIAISRREPQAIVIGSDQVLALGTRILSKAESVAEARDILDVLRGRQHDLFSAVAIAENGHVTWTSVDAARLTMRRFSDEFLNWYVSQAKDALLRSAGAYEIEGRGVHLFERVEGDYFTVLGLPLMALLNELRRRGLILT